MTNAIPRDPTEEDATITDVLDGPIMGGAWEEGEGEVSGNRDDAYCWWGGVRRDGGVEDSGIIKEAEWQGVELAKTSKKGAFNNDVAEGDTTNGDTDKVGWGG